MVQLKRNPKNYVVCILAIVWWYLRINNCTMQFFIGSFRSRTWLHRKTELQKWYANKRQYYSSPFSTIYYFCFPGIPGFANYRYISYLFSLNSYIPFLIISVFTYLIHLSRQLNHQCKDCLLLLKIFLRFWLFLTAI